MFLASADARSKEPWEANRDGRAPAHMQPHPSLDSACAGTRMSRHHLGVSTIRLRDGTLSAVCAQLGVSREGLARKLDVSPSTLYRVDRGDSDPSPRVIALLLEASGEPFETLFVTSSNKENL